MTTTNNAPEIGISINGVVTVIPAELHFSLSLHMLTEAARCAAVVVKMRGIAAQPATPVEGDLFAMADMAAGKTEAEILAEREAHKASLLADASAYEVAGRRACLIASRIEGGSRIGALNYWEQAMKAAEYTAKG